MENGTKVRDELLKNNEFDVLLVELDMPEIDGYELLTAMKEHETLKSIPIIIMSQEDDQDLIAGCLSNGAEGYFTKPLTS